MRLGTGVLSAALSAALLLAWGLTTAGAANGGVGCGSVITEDTVLTQDLLDCENGLIVSAPQVTLNLGGHQIVGRGVGEGVRVAAPGVAVEGGAIEGFGVGVALTRESSGSLTSNLEIASNGTGIGSLPPGRSGGHRIENSTIHHNGTGVAVIGAAEVEIVGNRILHNAGAGLFTVLADGSLVQGNQFRGNGSDGAQLVESTALVLDNTFSGNGRHGLWVNDQCFAGTTFYRVGSNLANGNAGLGLNVDIACPSPPFPPGLLDNLDAGGNAADRNGDPRECTVVQCALNRGQAKKFAPLPLAPVPARSQQDN